MPSAQRASQIARSSPAIRNRTPLKSKGTKTTAGQTPPHADVPEHSTGIHRAQVAYRSIRRSTSKVLYSVKKKVSDLEHTVNRRRALQPLNESPATPMFNSKRPSSYLEQLTPINLNAHANQSFTPTTPKVRATTSDLHKALEVMPKRKTSLKERATKLLARQRIKQLQSPRRTYAPRTPPNTTRDINDLVRNMQQLNQISNRLSTRKTAA